MNGPQGPECSCVSACSQALSLSFPVPVIVPLIIFRALHCSRCCCQFIAQDDVGCHLSGVFCGMQLFNGAERCTEGLNMPVLEPQCKGRWNRTELRVRRLGRTRGGTFWGSGWIRLQARACEFTLVGELVYMGSVGGAGVHQIAAVSNSRR